MKLRLLSAAKRLVKGGMSDETDDDWQTDFHRDSNGADRHSRGALVFTSGKRGGRNAKRAESLCDGGDPVAVSVSGGIRLFDSVRTVRPHRTVFRAGHPLAVWTARLYGGSHFNGDARRISGGGEGGGRTVRTGGADPCAVQPDDLFLCQRRTCLHHRRGGSRDAGKRAGGRGAVRIPGDRVPDSRRGGTFFDPGKRGQCGRGAVLPAEHAVSRSGCVCGIGFRVVQKHVPYLRVCSAVFVGH